MVEYLLVLVFFVVAFSEIDLKTKPLIDFLGVANLDMPIII